MIWYIIYMIVLGLVIWLGFKFDCIKYKKRVDMKAKKEYNSFMSQEYDDIEPAIRRD